MDGLYIVTMISNPVRYSSRYRLYNDFKERIKKYDVSLMTAEIAFGNRPFEITDAADPFNVQLPVA